jgi:hypothetical protein
MKATPARSLENRLCLVLGYVEVEKFMVGHVNERYWRFMPCRALYLTASLAATASQPKKRDIDFVESLAKRFQALPNAKVVFLPHATHSLYNSNRDDVVREIRDFTATLDPEGHGS